MAGGGLRCWLFVLCCCGWATVAAAQDWLAHLPECGHPAPNGGLQLLYPRPGLPAVVAPGDALLARVRLPLALTPPPGRQQPAALLGWRAELSGHGLALVDEPLEHRIPLAVDDIRPAGSSSVVYRVELLVPAWIAPGSYSLRLQAPGGRRALADVVRVVAPGPVPRLAPLTEPLPPVPPYADLGVDVWTDAMGLPSAPGFVQLATGADAVPAVVRMEARLIVLADCPDDPGQPRASARRLAEHGGGRLLSAKAAARALRPPPLQAAECGVAGARVGGGRRVRVSPSCPEPVTVTVLAPADTRPKRVSSAAHPLWFPATPPAEPGYAPTLAGRWTLAPGAKARIVLGEPHPFEVRFGVEPRVVLSGRPSRVSPRVRGASDGRAPVLAWQLEDGRSAFRRGPLERAWNGPGLRWVGVEAIDPRGMAVARKLGIDVQPRVSTRCGIAAGPRPSADAKLWCCALVVLASAGPTAARRQRQRAGRRGRRE